jgi:thiamine-phosphate pyrophosphorylase
VTVFDHPSHFLYSIIDVGVCEARGLDAAEVGGACLRGGARLLQLRQKAGTDAGLLAIADRLAGAARDAGACLIINDRADIARLSDAGGVHVGQEDLPVGAVRRLLGPDAIVGVSTHDDAQLQAALGTEASYVAVGPIFGTSTKDTGYTARGLDLVRGAAGRGKPVVAIGGITLASAPAVIAAGATSVAVISDLLATGDPEQRVRQYLQALGAVR